MFNEELQMLREKCFAVEKGIEEGEDRYYALGELYKKYQDPYLHPFYRERIGNTLKYLSFMKNDDDI